MKSSFISDYLINNVGKVAMILNYARCQLAENSFKLFLDKCLRLALGYRKN